MPRVDAGDGLIDPLDLATLADGFDKLPLRRPPSTAPAFVFRTIGRSTYRCVVSGVA